VIAKVLERCEIVEECYEFMLGYAAQGLPDDAGSPQVREFLCRAVDALQALEESCAEAVERERHEPVDRHSALVRFLAVLRCDAADSLAALELVLAQPTISSQLIDSLNASSHLRALLTDLFLLSEVLHKESAAESAESLRSTANT
jgi:hypothetical protein